MSWIKQESIGRGGHVTYKAIRPKLMTPLSAREGTMVDLNKKRAFILESRGDLIAEVERLTAENKALSEVLSAAMSGPITDEIYKAARAVLPLQEQGK